MRDRTIATLAGVLACLCTFLGGLAVSGVRVTLGELGAWLALVGVALWAAFCVVGRKT